MIFVAEIGSNHKGIKALAHEMIRKAAWAGADIAKFQFGWPEYDALDNLMREVQVRNIRYVDDWAPELKEWCDYYGIELMASIWSEAGLEAAKAVGMKRYKIAHQIAQGQPEFAEKIALASPDEPFVSGWKNRRFNWCGIYAQTKYPSYPATAYIPVKFSHVNTDCFGYSSHTPGIEDALLAIARGAQYIEKHVTLDKTEESIRDNHFALSFEEFKLMVEIGRPLARLV